MKIRSYSKQGQSARSLVRIGNVVNIYVDQGKDWRREEAREFPTVTAAKQFMNRPTL